MTLRKKLQKCFKQFIRGKAIVEWCGKMKQKYSLALIALFLINNNKLLKSSTSEHVKKMNVGHETGQHSSDFKKKMIFR